MTPFRYALILLVAVAPAMAGEPKKDDPLASLNQKFRDAYKQARIDRLAKAGPVLIVDGEKLILLRGKERQEADLDFGLYHPLKSVAHAPFGIYLLLAALPDGPLDKDRKDQLTALRPVLLEAERSLPKVFTDKEALSRQQALLKRCVEFVDRTAGGASFQRSQLTEFLHSVESLLRANLAGAARGQLDAYHARMLEWRRAVPAEEWARLNVIVMGSQLPRKDNVAVQYFAKWVGQPGEGRRLIYAEAIYDEQRALNLLGSHLLDRASAEDFFNDPTRLHRDLLGDAAAEHLRTLRFE
jgi:hypothetical protein